MPAISRYAIRAALVHLALGVTIGALLLANKALPFAPWIWSLLPAHIHMLLIGWTVQLAFGVAFWILPRLSAEGDRGSPVLSWLIVAGLNGGVTLAVLADLLRLLGSIALPGPLELAAFVCYGGVSLACARHFWPRLAAITLPSS
ncbi:MAG: hypothetical protein KatS3mg057_0614 [Herpetosiphonaceae bacterium]|nr:MAG: hypothetical protein KatS3mg057_0614 [Herpetosiphonaceae bacterium]